VVRLERAVLGDSCTSDLGLNNGTRREVVEAWCSEQTWRTRGAGRLELDTIQLLSTEFPGGWSGSSLLNNMID